MTLQRIEADEAINLRDCTDFAVSVARDAGKIIMQALSVGRYRGDVQTKRSASDLVSEVDRAAEALILDAIASSYPNHGWIAEEQGASEVSHGTYRWLVDPLDGTTNFLHGHPMFAVSIALEKRCQNTAHSKGEIVAAVVHAPYLDETFFAYRGGGAFLNSQAIRLEVSQSRSLADALLSTGFSPQKDRYPNKENFLRLANCCRAMRRCGSAALDLAYVAAGRYDGFWEFGLQCYDVAAGSLLVQEAGGAVRDCKGEQDWLFGGSIVAGPTAISDQLIEKLVSPPSQAP